MTIEVNLTQLIFLLIAAFSGLWALIKVLAGTFLRDQKKQLDDHKQADMVQRTLSNERLDAINETLRAEAGQWQRIERELLTLKADLPLNYVRREDYIRGQSVLESKLDALATKV